MSSYWTDSDGKRHGYGGALTPGPLRNAFAHYQRRVDLVSAILEGVRWGTAVDCDELAQTILMRLERLEQEDSKR